jgi:hypothetical protein
MPPYGTRGGGPQTNSTWVLLVARSGIRLQANVRPARQQGIEPHRREPENDNAHAGALAGQDGQFPAREARQNKIDSGTFGLVTGLSLFQIQRYSEG